MKKELKKKSGITLVALVVTIVVLLILAGITIVYVFGENGIFKLAQQAKENTEQAKLDEQEYLNGLDSKVNEYVSGNGTTNPPTQPDNPNSPTEDKTVADIVDQIQDTTTTVEDASGNQVVVPGGFKVVADTEENNVDYTYSGDKKPSVQDGIVIEDEEGNQFVWIPAGEIKNKDGTTTTITLGRYTFDTTNGKPTLEQNADNYTEIVTVTGIGGDYQELTSDSGNTAAKNLGDFVAKTKENGGYYLGRYEASQGTDGKVDSQANKVAWVGITQPNAATRAQEMYNSSYVESDLINSYSWDTAIVFIQNYSGNSNYANQKTANTSKLNTGMSGDKVCNIHDMASNYREWSTECSSRYPCVLRGEYWGNHGATANRYNYTTSYSSGDYGSFRSLMYIK